MGPFIVIEGIDGTGKTTLAKRLSDHLRSLGLSVVQLKEPTDGPYGQKIRALSKQGRQHVRPREELELFIQDRIENCRDNIRPALGRGDIVVMDRYYLSSVAYQGALGLDPQRILERNEAIAVRPDLVLLLNIPVKSGLDRISRMRKSSHDLFEGEAYLEKVRSIFLSLRRPFIRIVDASGDADTVFRAALAHVEPLLPAIRR